VHICGPMTRPSADRRHHAHKNAPVETALKYALLTTFSLLLKL
jgi:hypothetical protein